jgi:squalene-associated FAD-dependent desaturase
MRAYVIGGGLAGLSAALALADAGWAVTLYEAGPQAGGRCRSYFDRALGCVVDNGNHLLLSGNRAAFAYLDRIGTRGSVAGPEAPCFPFIDRANGARWTLRPSAGRIPWWLFAPSRRVPGTRARDYLRLLGFRAPPAGATVAAMLDHGALYRGLVEPLAIAALNTTPEEGLASLLGAVMRETLLAGGAACLPRIPRQSLAASLIDPALAALGARGAEVKLGQRVTYLRIEADRVAELGFAAEPVPLAPGDAAVLAVPPWIAAELLPGLAVPDAFEAIVNVHFRLDAPPGEAGFVGVLGGVAEWVFVKPGHVSVTISAANRLVDQPAEALAEAVWPDVRAALALPDTPPPHTIPPWRVVKERRATFAATASQEQLRPGARTRLANLALAGDWTATGLPATIEGAIRSGRSAAQLFGAAA